MPAGYLLLVNYRFVPLTLLAVGMVAARPLAGAHMWPQSIAELLLSVAFLLALADSERPRNAVQVCAEPDLIY